MYDYGGTVHACDMPYCSAQKSDSPSCLCSFPADIYHSDARHLHAFMAIIIAQICDLESAVEILAPFVAVGQVAELCSSDYKQMAHFCLLSTVVVLDFS